MLTDDDGGMMKPLLQIEHAAINAIEYPGTRQICVVCEQPTERCEEDAIYTDAGHGPLCLDCYHKTDEYMTEMPEYLARAHNET